jgi:hypothetical protein
LVNIITFVIFHAWYSSASTQRPEELFGGATPPPPKTVTVEQQVLEQTSAEKVVPELQAHTA